MSYTVTTTQLQDLFRQTPFSIIQKLPDALTKVSDKFEINTKKRMAMFLAQTGEESMGFKVMEENLHYRATALKEFFGIHFLDVNVNDYANQPEKIANRVYANRMGNGDEASGDGWRYRGRGYIQLTGKDEYESFAAYAGMSLDDVINYLETVDGAMLSAGWYWNSRHLNEEADVDNIRECTHLINGGYNGLSARLSLYNHALKVLS